MHVLGHDEHPGHMYGTLAGLGNDNLNTHVSVSGFALHQCQNGGGSEKAAQGKGGSLMNGTRRRVRR